MANFFLGIADFVKRFFPFLKSRLVQAKIEQDDREYTAKAIARSFFFLVFLAILLLLIFFLFEIKEYKLILIVAPIFSLLFFLQQIFKPIILAERRVKDMERNLLPALQDIFVQINSGIVLFEVLVNISRSSYGEVSKEFAKSVKEINAGKPEIEALEEMAVRNPSLFFRRVVWQIINGMKGGADISIVIEETNRFLSEEQAIQIQTYGSRLSPLAMFYMLIGVILPALSITFVILLLSFIETSQEGAKEVFYGFYAIFLFFQIIFVGLISSRRPNLL